MVNTCAGVVSATPELPDPALGIRGERDFPARAATLGTSERGRGRGRHQPEKRSERQTLSQRPGRGRGVVVLWAGPGGAGKPPGEHLRGRSRGQGRAWVPRAPRAGTSDQDQ